MNSQIIDPLQGDFPEMIEEFLEHGIMKCVAFNRRGTYVAAGCSDGACVIWDFITRGVYKVLSYKDCAAAITSISWSKNGGRVLVSAADKSLMLWDVRTGVIINHMTLEQTPLKVSLCPSSSAASLCLVCNFSSAPMLVDLDSKSISVLPASVSDMEEMSAPASHGNGFPSFVGTVACFNKHGSLVYIGNSKGEIIVVDRKSFEVRAVISLPGGAVIKNIVFSRNGKLLLTNSNDRVIRVFENRLPLKQEVMTLDDLDNTETGPNVSGNEKLKALGSKCLPLLQELQDSVNKVHWKAPCFSGRDGEWIAAGSASKGEHKVYIWDRSGHLIKILEGPNEAMTDLEWHPVHPIILSVSMIGLVYIWAKEHFESWKAFAPDFTELEENEEYVEREDEFDLVPDTEKVKASEIDEDEEVDIITMDKNSGFSDSDMSEEEICFFPVSPIPEDTEQQDLKNTSNLMECNQSGCSFSEDGGQRG